MSAASNKPPIVACIPAYNEEWTIGDVVVPDMKYLDRVVVCYEWGLSSTGWYMILISWPSFLLGEGYGRG